MPVVEKGTAAEAHRQRTRHQQQRGRSQESGLDYHSPSSDNRRRREDSGNWRSGSGWGAGGGEVRSVVAALAPRLGAPSRDLCAASVAALAAHLRLPLPRSFAAGGASFNLASSDPALASLLSALSDSLEAHPGAWPAASVARMSSEATSFAKRRGALPRQAASYLSSPLVRRLLRAAALAFLPQVHSVPPGLQAGMLASLARAGVTFAPLTGAVAAWLGLSETASAASASGAALLVPGEGMGVVNSCSAAQVQAWRSSCDPDGRLAAFAADRRRQAASSSASAYAPPPLDGTPAGTLVQLMWAFTRPGSTEALRASSSSSSSSSSIHSLAPSSDVVVPTTPSAVFAPTFAVLLVRLLPHLRALAGPAAAGSSPSLSLSAAHGSAATTSLLSAYPPSRALRHLPSMESSSESAAAPDAYDYGWWRKMDEEWRVARAGGASSPLAYFSRGGGGVKGIERRPGSGGEAAGGSAQHAAPPVAQPLTADRLPQLLESLAASGLPLSRAAGSSGNRDESAGDFVESLAAEAARLCCAVLAREAHRGALVPGGLGGGNNHGPRDGRGAPPPNAPWEEDDGPSVEARHVASLLRVLAASGLAHAHGEGCAAATALVDRAQRLLASQAGAAAAWALEQGGFVSQPASAAATAAASAAVASAAVSAASFPSPSSSALNGIVSAFKPSELTAALVACARLATEGPAGVGADVPLSSWVPPSGILREESSAGGTIAFSAPSASSSAVAQQLQQRRTTGLPSPAASAALRRAAAATVHLARDAVVTHAVLAGGAQEGSMRAQVALLCAHAAAGAPLAPLAAQLCREVVSATDASVSSFASSSPSSQWWTPALLCDLAWGLSASLHAEWEGVAGRGTDGRGPYVARTPSPSSSLQGAAAERGAAGSGGGGGEGGGGRSGGGEATVGVGGSAVPASSLRGAVAACATLCVGAASDPALLTDASLAQLLWALAAADVYHTPLLVAAAGRLSPATEGGRQALASLPQHTLTQVGWAAALLAARPAPPALPSSASSLFSLSSPYASALSLVLSHSHSARGPASAPMPLGHYTAVAAAAAQGGAVGGKRAALLLRRGEEGAGTDDGAGGGGTGRVGGRDWARDATALLEGVTGEMRRRASTLPFGGGSSGRKALSLKIALGAMDEVVVASAATLTFASSREREKGTASSSSSSSSSPLSFSGREGAAKAGPPTVHASGAVTVTAPTTSSPLLDQLAAALPLALAPEPAGRGTGAAGLASSLLESSSESGAPSSGDGDGGGDGGNSAAAVVVTTSFSSAALLSRGAWPGPPLPRSLLVPLAVPSRRLAFSLTEEQEEWGAAGGGGGGGGRGAGPAAAAAPQGKQRGKNGLQAKAAAPSPPPAPPARSHLSVAPAGGWGGGGSDAASSPSPSSSSSSRLAVERACERRLARDLLRAGGWTTVELSPTALRGAGGLAGKARYIRKAMAAAGDSGGAARALLELGAADGLAGSEAEKTSRGRRL